MGIIYAMSDIHADIEAFENALDLVEPDLKKNQAKLVLLGDYIHGRDPEGGKKVIRKIMSLQKKYGNQVIALCGNHEQMVLNGYSTIQHMKPSYDEEEDANDYEYTDWMSGLGYYYSEGNTIFVHAGIDEELKDDWEESDMCDFLDKFPASLGKMKGLKKKIVAGHVETSQIACDRDFHDIYYDGENHYYIDGATIDTGNVLVIKVDTENDRYYSINDYDEEEIQTYSNM